MISPKYGFEFILAVKPGDMSCEFICQLTPQLITVGLIEKVSAARGAVIHLQYHNKKHLQAVVKLVEAMSAAGEPPFVGYYSAAPDVLGFFIQMAPPIYGSDPLVDLFGTEASALHDAFPGGVKLVASFSTDISIPASRPFFDALDRDGHYYLQIGSDADSYGCRLTLPSIFSLTQVAYGRG